jgi:Tfp pilus assembly protein PilF
MPEISKNLRLIVLLLLSALNASGLEFSEQGEYIGSSKCLSCHERFYELWSTSHHGKAMQAFSAAFARTLEPMQEPLQIGESSFIVELNGAGGLLHHTGSAGEKTTYPILHALGGKNVYFFLVPLEKGKLQVAPLAYNVHSKIWYDSTGSMVRHFNNGIEDSPLEWTDRQLTFNTACHDCHISQLEKNYDPESDSYMTTWSEAGINCEVCHGPAEAHVKAAEEALAKGEELKEVKLARFHKDLDAVQRDATCAPCHAKMNPLTGDFMPGDQFFDHYDLTSYENPDFYPDGRDLGENYTQTGWMANPCAQSGQMECIDCHTSSGRFRFADNPNQACLPCHQKRVDNILDHSHHKAEDNVSCIDCHMPKTAQAHMHRSDHTLRPPSPAASLEFGSPNACNLCHNNKEAITGDFHGHKEEDILWAKKAVEKWHGADSGSDILEMGRIIEACRQNDWSRLPEILAYLDSPKSDQPTKVTILRMMAFYPYPYADKWPIIRRQLKSEHEWVRSAAADALRYDDSTEGTVALIEATRDAYRTVRIRAAGALIGRDLSGYSESGRQAFSAARDEYWDSLTVWPDRWSSHYNQGIYFDRIGDSEKAMAAYQKAMGMRSDVIQPIINASMVQARAGNSTNAYELLKRGLEIENSNPMVNFNMALLEAEFGNMEACEERLRAALESEPGMAQAAYNLGVLLCRAQKAEGHEWLRKAAVDNPENWNYASSAIYFLNQNDRSQEAETLLKEIIATKRAAPEAYFSLAGIYQNDGRISTALEIYRKAAQSRWLQPEARRYAIQMQQSLEAK